MADVFVMLLGILAILGLVFVMAYIGIMSLIYKLEAEAILAGKGNFWKRFYNVRRLPLSQQAFLQQRFNYYKSLTAPNQQRFETRMAHLLEKLAVEGRDGLVVTNEMRILLAASLVKLTFGYRKYQIAALKKIILYPEIYYSQHTQSFNKGETHTGGAVVLSWKDTLAGIAVDDDNLHLALHEFAHALYLTHKHQLGVDQRFSLHWHYWVNYVNQQENIAELRQAGLLRDYAFTNQAELFACMVETFFESTDLFIKVHPKLFRIMSFLLNQYKTA